MEISAKQITDEQKERQLWRITTDEGTVEAHGTGEFIIAVLNDLLQREGGYIQSVISTALVENFSSKEELEAAFEEALAKSAATE